MVALPDPTYIGWRLAAVLMLAVLALSAYAQEGLPQLDEKIDLSESASKQLRATFSGPESPTALTLSSKTNSLLVGLLPDGFRDSCGKMNEYWGGKQNETQWSVRLLNVAHEKTTVRPLLVFRCTSSEVNDATHTPYYDERPALLQMDDQAAFLTFIPLAAKGCSQCYDLYRVEFVETLPVAHGELIELRINTSDDVPNSSAIDHYDREALLWVALPQVHVALQVDSHNESSNCDGEDCSEQVCASQVRDSRDESGHVAEITNITTCTVDEVEHPAETARYVWKPAAAHFEKTGAAKP
jgi:hypothetical protein